MSQGRGTGSARTPKSKARGCEWSRAVATVATVTLGQPRCPDTKSRPGRSSVRSREAATQETTKELQVSAAGGTEDVGNLLESHFSAGDASLEEKERGLYAEATPRDQTSPLHYPDGREAESPDTTSGAPSAAAAPGSDPEASLVNASASESAVPQDPAWPGEEAAGAAGVSSLPSEGEGRPREEGRPELSSGEGPLEEGPGLGLPTEGAAHREATEAGQDGAPVEDQAAPGLRTRREAAAATAAPDAAEGASAGLAMGEARGPGPGAGEGSPGAEPDPEVTAGAEDVDAEARERAEDHGEPSSSPAPEASVETGTEGTEHAEVGGAREAPATEGPPPGKPEEGREASSEEEGGEHGGSEEGGAPSLEESEEDSGDGASSEEAEGGPGDAEEPSLEAQEPGAPSPEDRFLSGQRGSKGAGPARAPRRTPPSWRGTPAPCLSGRTSGAGLGLRALLGTACRRPVFRGRRRPDPMPASVPRGGGGCE
ncbi:PREDICTED: sarcalumenin-like [Condylura cristata]|uniref:sarcalumenin-like n=1 Tax=Condylura cristata TaxID=143302 RepID=UPI0006431C89|nr:PREDICTED: sarcalumenin-like [Condylura cristata]